MSEWLDIPDGLTAISRARVRPGVYARAYILACARAFIGTRFQHQGRLPGVALDCAGQLICTARAIGYVPQDFDITGYRRRPSGDEMLAWCRAYLDEIPRGKMLPGDVVVFKVGDNPQHVGIVGDYKRGGLSIIHAISREDGTGSVVETRLRFISNLQFVAAFRFRGVGAWPS